MSEPPVVSRPARILVPVDLSPRAEIAIAHAAMLAEACDAELLLVTNVNLPEQAALEEFARREGTSTDDAADAALRCIASRLAPGIPVSTLATFADYPADGILDAAERHAADMIVVASHGRGGVKRWLLGSVAEKLARGSHVPVVVVPARQDD